MFRKIVSNISADLELKGIVGECRKGLVGGNANLEQFLGKRE